MSGYRIKNWEKFQHYQDGKRKPEWIKLYRHLLDDVEWFELDPKDSKVLVMLWMLASENGGALPPIKKIAFRLRLPEKEIKSILSRLPHWLEVHDSEALSDCYQSDSPEEEEQETSRKKKENENALSREFAETFWPAYPNKVGKPKAEQSFAAARKKHPLETIMAGLRCYVAGKPPDRQWLNPATFLNQARFLDQPAAVATAPPERISRTEAASRKIAEEIASGKFGGTGICDERSEASARQLPKPSARPGDVTKAANYSLHGAPEGYFEPDGEPDDGASGEGELYPLRCGGEGLA